jgi:hypothetical protein
MFAAAATIALTPEDAASVRRLRLEDDRVIVIARCARQHHLDLAPLHGLDQAVHERVVRFGVGV